MGRVTTRRPVVHLSAGEPADLSRPDTLVVEEPLEIRVNGTALAVTMRTPGHDVELALGFLVSEGIVGQPHHVVAARYCVDGREEHGEQTYNVLDVTLASDVAVPEASMQRNVLTTSACGICGRSSIEAVRTNSPYDVATDELSVSRDVLSALPESLRAQQGVFDRTGGLHAVGLFTADGSAVVVREDVGRHNAFDKVVGWALREERLPLSEHIAMVSGRASFELVQKAQTAGIPLLAAVSAPSSLAVDLAVESGMTLLGFVRGTSMNVYAGGHRIVVG
jgi:FdhD protein